MADKMLRMAGRGEDGKAKALKTDNNGNLNVQLTGSNAVIKEHSNYNSLISAASRFIGESIGNSSSNNALDVSNYPSRSFRVRNGHDVSIFVSIRTYKDANVSWDDDSMINEITDELEVLPGETVYLNSAKYPQLEETFIGMLVRIARYSTPTSGDIDVTFLGGNTIPPQPEKDKSPEIVTLYEGTAEPGHNEVYTHEADPTVDELYVLISSDKGEWRIGTSVRPFDSNDYHLDGVYPHMPPTDVNFGYTNTVHSKSNPWRGLVCFPPEGSPEAVWSDENNRYEYPDFKTAYRHKNGKNKIDVRFRKPGSGETSNVKIALLKVWR